LILLMGPPGGGKTLFFYKLKSGKLRETLTSMKENDAIFPLNLSTVAANTSSIITPIAYRVVDIPGAERLRKNILRSYDLSSAKLVLLVLDAFDLHNSLQASAEILYDLLTNDVIVQHRVPIVALANKADIAFYKKEQVKKQLELEIEKIRKTKLSQPDSLDNDQQQRSASSMALITPNDEKFSLDKHCTTDFSMLDCSIMKDINMEAVYSSVLQLTSEK